MAARYQLRAQDGTLPLAKADLTELGLQAGMTLSERELRLRADQLTSRSTREAIHAMLDQEEPGTLIWVQVSDR